jgi:hypothetical protein
MDMSQNHPSGASVDQFKKLAKEEVSMLKLLNKIDHEQGFIVRMKEHFKHKKTVCVVFEHLEVNLRQLLMES